MLASLSTAAVVAAVQWLSEIGGLSGTANAVGRATFVGLSVRGNVMATFAALAASVGLGSIAVLAWARNRDLKATPLPAREPQRRIWPWLLIFVLLAVPNLELLIKGTAERQFHTDWDSNNIVVWNWLIHSGYVPLRD